MLEVNTMKKVLLTFCLLVSTFMLTGCKNEGIKFKQNYESLNGKENKYGGTYRSVTIPENNPFVYTTATDIIEKIENNETFYVYFGDELCPWCRSVIEKASEIRRRIPHCGSHARFRRSPEQRGQGRHGNHKRI